MLIAVAFGVAVLGSVAQTVVGFGFALLLSPVMFLLLDPAEAVFCTLLAATLQSVIVLGAERARVNLDRGIVLGLTGGIVPGALIGALLLGLVSKGVLQISVAVIALAATLPGQRAARARRPLAFDAMTIPIGAIAGALNSAISTGGPPVALWLQSTVAELDEVRHTLAVAFLVMNLAAMGAVAALQPLSFHSDAIAVGAATLCAVPVGYLAGCRLLGRVRPALFATLVTAMIWGIAWSSLIVGVASLAGGR